MIAPLAAILLAAFIGSLPTGYLLARRLRGVDIRRFSPHNLGLGTVAAAAGPGTLALVTALDLAKGAAAVAAARGVATADWTLAVAAAAAVAGHVYSPLMRFVPRASGRMKGVVTTTGAVAGLAALGTIPGVAVAGALAAAVAVLVIPRWLGGTWGYLSVATVVGAAALPVGLAALGARTPYVVVSGLYALIALWYHKEHLLRIADGVEPRLGERLPLPGIDGGEAVAAFMIHPMNLADVLHVRRFRVLTPLRHLGMISDATVRRFGRFVRPIKVDDIYPIVTADGRRARVYLIGVPMMPDQIRSEPELAVRRAVQTAELAANLGATVLGLGAYWSVVGNKGIDVQARAPITITNGGAYTAGTVKIAVPRVLDRLRQRGVDPARATAAVVGANGVVGFGICRAIVEHVGRLIMLGTDRDRLDRSRDLLRKRYPGAVIDATTSTDALRDAHVIFTATSAAAPVIFPQHVRPGCVIFDLGRPPDVHPSVATVPGVEVMPGGVVRLPGAPKGRLDLGYGDGLVPACLAETVILALDGQHERTSLGDRTKAENIEYFVERGRALGIEVLGAGQAAPPSPTTAPASPTSATA
ncbi:MAG: glycerol-3-phosphate acyltransferase [Armatimonadota bacterium]|nr:glycerol-3-phosphate acyltransferase [Armatimonadota bacterium]